MRGKRSSEHQSKAANHTSGLRNLLRCDEAEGNPPRGIIKRTTPSVSLCSTAPSKREPRELSLFPCLPPRGRWHGEAVTEGVIGLPRRCEADAWEEGEQALPWQSHGVALTAFELGNGALCAPFPDRARVLPREMSEHQSKAANHTSGLQNLLRCDEGSRKNRIGEFCGIKQGSRKSRVSGSFGIKGGGDDAGRVGDRMALRVHGA